MRDAEVVVLGLGAVGSATALHLARRGLRVLGLDRHRPPHTLGSSHGRSRIIREAYYEDPRYVPMLRRAYDLWAGLEAEWGAPLLVRTGGLMIGPPDGHLVAGARGSAELHGIPHERLDAAEVRRRFPSFRVPEDQVALLEHRAGVLLPERCIEAQLTLAERAGAELRTGVEVRGWRRDGAGVTVETADGPVRAGRLVVAAGPWLPELLAAHGGPRLPLWVERQLSHWFVPRVEALPTLGPDRCPISLWEHAPGRFFATLPDLGDGVKCGTHHDGPPTTPATVDRTVHADEVAAAAGLLGTLLPDAAGRARESRVCLYTNTPDTRFVIDHHPDEPNVVIASACSGHGFKFAVATGEAAADLATDRAPAVDLAAFGTGRFA